MGIKKCKKNRNQPTKNIFKKYKYSKKPSSEGNKINHSLSFQETCIVSDGVQYTRTLELFSYENMKITFTLKGVVFSRLQELNYNYISISC